MMVTKKPDATGLLAEMPRRPGDAKSGQPIRRDEIGGELPACLDSSKAKWTKARVDATFGPQRYSKIGAPDIADLPDAMNSIIPSVPGYQLPSPVKEPKRAF
jgi:hypothetical protein